VKSYEESSIMITKSIVSVALALVGISLVSARAGEASLARDNAPGKPSLVCDVYPSLASSGLTYARLSDLPAGVLMKAGSITITDKDVDSEIAKAPPETQAQLKKNRFFALESMATLRIVLALARPGPVEQKALSASDEKEVIQKYLKGMVANMQVSDAEVTRFYEENKDGLSGATLDQVKDQIKQLVLQQKQQAVVDEHIRTMGQRMPIEVAAAWVKEQSVLARDNPVDKARSSGKPSLVDFGSTGCKPCDMLAPILEALRKKYEGKVNVVFIHVGQEQILASRYGIQSIPAQFFYDKDGKEVFRHVGFWPQDEIEKKLAEMGVKP
jgi:thiol-disulfide isomerase/thioredoxin